MLQQKVFSCGVLRSSNFVYIPFDKVRATWELIAATVRPPWVAPALVGPRHLGGDGSYCATPLGSALSNFWQLTWAVYGIMDGAMKSSDLSIVFGPMENIWGTLRVH